MLPEPPPVGDAHPTLWSGWLALLVGAYLVTRLWALTLFPSFIDEAMHIDAARATLRGHLLAGSWEGRWLSIKIMSAFVALPLSPLCAARLSAALAGLGALVACVLLGRQLYSPAVGITAGFAYLVLPYALLYNRMALAETYAAAFTGAVLCLSVRMVRADGRRDVALLAIALVCMVLAKLHTVLLVPVPLAAVLFLAPRSVWRRQIVRVAWAFVPVALIVALMVWRGHGIHYIGEQAAGGWPTGALVARNLIRAGAWLWALLTPPIVSVSLVAVAWAARSARQRADAFLAAAILLNVVPFILAAQTWFPRYLTPALIPLCVLLSRSVHAAAAALRHRYRDRAPLTVGAGVTVAVLALLAWPLWCDALIILRPAQAPLPRIERGEFFEGTGAGTGVPELADFLRARASASAEGVNVLRFSFWNQANQGLDLYLSPGPSLGVHTVDPNDHDARAAIARFAARRPSFFVLNPPSEARHLAAMGKSIDDFFHGAEKVWADVRPGGKSAMEVWQLRSP